MEAIKRHGKNKAQDLSKQQALTELITYEHTHKILIVFQKNENSSEILAIEKRSPESLLLSVFILSFAS